MIKVMEAVKYIANYYSKIFGEEIDEMKLHKLLYFAQRESFIQNDKPLFNAVFYGWKFGPVLKEIRQAYKEDKFFKGVADLVVDRDNVDINVLNTVLKNYAHKNSWSLSRLTHGEISWINSRKGLTMNDNGDNPMENEDIKLDAERIKQRRQMIASLNLS